jgi:hypothetical protein
MSSKNKSHTLKTVAIFAKNRHFSLRKGILIRASKERWFQCNDWRRFICISSRSSTFSTTLQKFFAQIINQFSEYKHNAKTAPIRHQSSRIITNAGRIPPLLA